MKELFTLLLITTVAFAPLNAQDITIGAKAGLNFATLQPDLNDPKSRTSFHLGGMAEIPINEMFSVQPELLYSSQGVKDESDDDEVVRLNYISLPVLAKYYVIEALSIEAGPQFGFLISAEVEDNGETIDIKDDTKSVDVGFAIGAGYKLESGLNFGIRYFLGSDINDIGEDPEKFKNRVFQISVGYFFTSL
ncbi:MAG: porin family protein [Aurantibacter sp.]